MPTPIRVRIVKGADLTPEDHLCFYEEQDFDMPGHAEREYLVLDNSPGVWLEGVTAEELDETANGYDPPREMRERVLAAIRKAAG